MCCIRKMANKCAETVVETFRSIVASTFFDFALRHMKCNTTLH
ncbi:hypothetical protein PsalSR1_04326 (plasmid) [Piscirickettsia salmonis]|nr:hypothetical protein PsalSR1_04326 [Piscirickettsia salmonis]